MLHCCTVSSLLYAVCGALRYQLSPSTAVSEKPEEARTSV